MEELQRFGRIANESLRRHAIDLHLHRFPEAVKHLHAAGPQHFPQVKHGRGGGGVRWCGLVRGGICLRPLPPEVLSLAKVHGLLRMLLGLTCICLRNHLPQVLSLAKEHGLLRMLLGLCPAPPPQGDSSASSADGAGVGGGGSHRAQVLDAYGEALEGEHKHEDAGVAFLAAGQLAKALQAYR